MELVIVILFFSLSSAVCVQLFVKAHQLDQETVNLNHSVIWIQNLAESYRAYQGDIDKVAAIYEEQLPSSSQDLVLYFDSDWNLITDEAHRIYTAFSVSLSPNETVPSASSHGVLKEAVIHVSDLSGSEPVVLTTQTIDCYVPSFVGEEGQNK